MLLFDSHAHYNDKRFTEDRDALLESMASLGVGYIANIGCSVQSSRESIALAEQYPFVYAAVGIHPHDAEEADENDVDVLRVLAAHEKVRAIGEIGLDYYYNNSPRDVQKDWFHRQMVLARELKMPVIIHDRDAHGDCYDICRAYPDVTGVFHCYSGSFEYAKLVLNLGYMLSFTGVITFKNAQKFEEIIRYAPLDRIMVETDCPYLAPEPMRGKRNHSGYMRYTAEKIAEIKGISFDEAAEATTRNAMRFYGVCDG